MTLQEFEKCYPDEPIIEKVNELRAFCNEMCDKRNSKSIFNALIKARVYSIESLRDRDFNAMPKRFLGTIGEMRMAFIEEMQSYLRNN